MRHTARSLTALGTAALLAGCGGGSGSKPAGTARDALVATSIESPGSNCAAGGTAVRTGVDTNGNGVLDPAEVTSTVYVCNGTSGSAGRDGASTLVSTATEPAGAHCPDGGIAVRSGVDANADGTLDAAEVQQVSYACNGAIGGTGAAGATGATGLTSLLAFAVEPAGPNCAAGGTAILAGVDADRNGVLDPSEVSQTRYACNGVSASAAPPGSISGTVTDAVLRDGLAGIEVTVRNWGGATIATGTTGATGAYSVSAAAGDVFVSFAGPFFTSPGELHVTVAAGQTAIANAALSESASGKPSVSVAAAGEDVGYGASVALTATASDPNGDALTYAWSNTTAPVLGSVGGNGVTGSMVMPSMAEAFAYRPDPSNPGQYLSGYQLEDRVGLVPVLTDTRGQVTAKVTVTDGRGQSNSASVTVSAASLVGGVRNVGVGTRVYLNSGHGGTSDWSVSSRPADSQAQLDDASSRTPSLVLDRPGRYVVGEGAAALTLEAGSWVGALVPGAGSGINPDPSCTVCHASSPAPLALDEFTPWLATGHASLFTRGIDGAASDHYGGSCVSCHTVGYDEGVSNNGFDDAARAAGWSFPTQLAPSGWEDLLALAPSVARLANVQCESCHGPNDSSVHMATDVFDPTLGNLHRPFASPRISYASEACATCHAAGAHHLYSEWATPAPPDAAGLAMAHSSRAGALHGASAPGLNSSCGRCHTAQGYLLYGDALAAGNHAIDANNAVVKVLMKDVTPANVEPVTCPTCHDPHGATNPNQLRVYGDTPNLPAGFAGYGMGKGALCLTCHNSRNGGQPGSLSKTYLHEDGEAYNAGNPTGYSTPHQACQGDVFTGHNAYFMSGSLPMTSRHAAVQDTCVGCHMTLNPRGYLSHGTPTASGHLFRILPEDRRALCSTCHGALVDGEGIRAQVEASLGALDAKMGKAVVARINAAGTVRVRAWDPATDLYSSTSASNVIVDVVANPATAASLVEVHGQVALTLTFLNPIDISFVDGSGNPVGAPKSMSSFAVQLSAVKDLASAPLYSLTGNFVRAGWNFFLVKGDQSLGLHNPTFVQTVLASTLGKDMSN